MSPAEKKAFLLKNMPRGSRLARLGAFYPDLDVPAMEVFGALLETAAEILSGVNRSLSRKGLSQARFRVLLHLRGAGQAGLHPMDIAEALGVERATVTGLVDGIEKAGLARRLPCPGDRRAIMVALTPAGVRLADSVAPARQRKISGLLAGLSAAEKKELVRLLDKVKARLPDFRKTI